MKKVRRQLVFSLLAVGVCAAAINLGCQASLANPPKHALPAPTEDLTYKKGATRAEVVVAGGCFWCTEAVFEQIVGVTNVVSGYAGGKKATAHYKNVLTGRTGHSEANRITFDPSKISFGEIMQIFFTMHDSTQRNGQGPDIGQQYRSTVFYANEQEKEVVEAYIRQLNKADVLEKPIATRLKPLKSFYLAEDYHQDYVRRNPGDSYVQRWALPKIAKVRKLFPDEVKKPATASAYAE